VGSYRANKFGLFDMLGNVWEWTCSAYTKGGYDGHEKTCTNEARSNRAIRGGAWSANAFNTGNRNGADPMEGNYNTGFRLVQE
jgi:formylglycine-generating enzyme required for sulfatase activity